MTAFEKDARNLKVNDLTMKRFETEKRLVKKMIRLAKRVDNALSQLHHIQQAEDNGDANYLNVLKKQDYEEVHQVTEDKMRKLRREIEYVVKNTRTAKCKGLQKRKDFEFREHVFVE